MRVWRYLTLFLALSAMLAPAAWANGAPRASTLPIANLTPTSVTLVGRVDPNGFPTTWVFQYGTSSRYTARTPRQLLPGLKPQVVSAGVSGLEPATTYHFRLAALNPVGAGHSRDVTLRTPPIPKSATIAASPNPVSYGGLVAISGVLTGTGTRGAQVVLEQNPFPYLAGFAQLGDAHVIDPQGGFAFYVPSLLTTTQFRVVARTNPPTYSPVAAVGVAVVTTLHVRPRRAKRKQLIEYFGSVTPASDGSLVAIQRLGGDGVWRTVGQTVLRHASAASSKYKRRIPLRQAGVYRAVALVASGAYGQGASPGVAVHRSR